MAALRPTSRSKLSFELAVSTLISGIFSGCMAIVMCVAFAALIFSGQLSAYLSRGIALTIAGTVFVGVIAGALTHCKPSIIQPDDDTAPIYALMAALVAASIPVGFANEAVLATVVVAILLATVLSGLSLMLIGLFKFGSLIEYLPYSVMGGYFAAVGWLLVIGSLRVAADLPLDSLASIYQLFDAANSIQSLAAIMIGLSIFLLRKRVMAAILFPVVTGIGIAIFYLIALANGSSIAALIDAGWLIGPFSEVQVPLFSWLPSLALGKVHWASIYTNGGSIAVIVLLSLVSFMLTVGGLNVLNKQDVDINNELKINGFANLLGGFSGAMAALPSVGFSTLAKNIGAPPTRWTGLIAAIFCGIFYYAGLDIIGYLPRLVIGGILMYLGLSFMHEWLVEARLRYPFHEYIVIPIILLVAATAGFLEGVLIGVLAAVLLFVVKYSQIKVIRFEGDGTQFQSNVERQPAERAYINSQATQIVTIGLQGYLFFGTSGTLYKRLKTLVESYEHPVNYIIVDFDQVSGVDASSGLNFEKLLQLVASKNVFLIVAGLRKELRNRLVNTSDDNQSLAHVSFVKDIDYALEWCENQILADFTPSKTESLSLGFLDQLRSDDDKNIFTQFVSFLEVRDVEANYMLTAQDDSSDELFFIESGSASAFINDGSNGQLRVRRTGSGMVYGEIGFYLNTPRTASVITEEASRVYILSRQAMARMEIESPNLAAKLQNYMIVLIAERLFLTTQTLRTVLR